MGLRVLATSDLLKLRRRLKAPGAPRAQALQWDPLRTAADCYSCVECIFFCHGVNCLPCRPRTHEVQVTA